MMRWTAAGVAVAAWLVGCSGDTEGSGNGGTAGGGTGGVGGAGAIGGVSGAGAVGGTGAVGGSAGGGSCPTSPPQSGAPCTPPATTGFPTAVAHCSWGDDPRPRCRTTAKCEPTGSWTVTAPDAACSSPPLPAACPSTPPASGSVCSDKALGCWYADGMHCWCSECKGGSGYPVCQTIDPPEWACSAPVAGCPALLPQAGTACSTEGKNCSTDCEMPIVCKDGVWVWQQGDCPICASPDTPIATPSGNRPIAELQPGDLVYSVDSEAIVAVPVVRAESTPVAAHHMVRLTLGSGATLEMSAGHPTATGRRFGDLLPGDALDSGHVVLRVEIVPFAHPRTHDILPASRTGSYFAAGALVGSSLFEPRTRR